MRGSVIFLALCFLVGALVAPVRAEQSSSSDAQAARKLIGKLTWGILSTTGQGVNSDVAIQEQGEQATITPPFASVVSYSDGVDTGLGVPYFLFSGMSERVKDLNASPLASFTISQTMDPHGGCGKLDPEDPRCSKLTLIGKVEQIPDSDGFGLKALIKRHPQMAGWVNNKSHGFKVYKMVEISKVILLNGFGGAKHIDPKEYLSATVSELDSIENEQTDPEIIVIPTNLRH